MLVTAPRQPAATGTQGIALASAAEKLESVLWQQVLSAMDKASMAGSSLGTGSKLYNGIANQALSTSLFGRTDKGLTASIVSQLEATTQAGSHVSDLRKGLPRPSPSTMDALADLPSSMIGHLDHSVAPILDRAVSYARSIWPAIQASAATLHVPAVAILAQSALETGWGGSTPGNNLFGIKAGAGQPSVTAATAEEIGGKMVPTSAHFASFPSIEAAVDHYTNLIETRFSSAMGSSNVSQFANQLAQGGYATDQNYASKIIDIAQSPVMQTVLYTLEGPPS